MREARRVRHTIVVMTDRIDARAIAITGFADAFESPCVRWSHRKARRPVAVDTLAGNVLQDRLGEPDVGQKFPTLLFRRAKVRESVACQLVARVRDTPYQV